MAHYYAFRKTATTEGGEVIGHFDVDTRMVDTRAIETIFYTMDVQTTVWDDMLKLESSEAFTWGEIELVKVEADEQPLAEIS